MSRLASQHAPDWEKFLQWESEVCAAVQGGRRDALGLKWQVQSYYMDILQDRQCGSDGLRSQAKPAQLPTSSKTLNGLFKFPVPQFPHL